MTFIRTKNLRYKGRVYTYGYLVRNRRMSKDRKDVRQEVIAYLGKDYDKKAILKNPDKYIKAYERKKQQPLTAEEVERLNNKEILIKLLKADLDGWKEKNGIFRHKHTTINTNSLKVKNPIEVNGVLYNNDLLKDLLERIKNMKEKPRLDKFYY